DVSADIHPASSEPPVALGISMASSQDDTARPKSASPILSQQASSAASPKHRHTQSASTEVPLKQLSEMSEKADQLMNIPLALNEPPIPLYLSEDMSPGHLLAVLAMLARQIECAVAALESRWGTSDPETTSTIHAETDSNVKLDDEIVTDGALRLALQKVASENCSALSSSGFEWTQEDVVRALEAYANRIEKTLT
ncbi:hypothetical protein LPJ73_004018, partial [Coemansia sp. RSA 2703]